MKPNIVTKEFVLRKRIYNKAYTTTLLKTLQNNPAINHYQSCRNMLTAFRRTHGQPVKNYCIVTGNARGVVNKYRLVRHAFRTFAHTGWLVGIRKASF